MTRDALNADGRTLRKLASDGEITLDGELVKLSNGKKTAATPALAPPKAAAPPPTALTTTTESPAAPAPAPKVTPITPIEAHVCTDDCSTCATGRALAFLTRSSPALAAMVARFQAHDADQQRLNSFES